MITAGVATFGRDDLDDAVAVDVARGELGERDLVG